MRRRRDPAIHSGPADSVNRDANTMEDAFLMRGSTESSPSETSVRVARTRTVGRVAIVTVVLASALAVLPQAEAASNCGSSGGHTLCLAAASVLSGEQAVSVTNTPNSGLVIATWT